jgi:hypothetical protein
MANKTASVSLSPSLFSLSPLSYSLSHSLTLSHSLSLSYFLYLTFSILLSLSYFLSSSRSLSHTLSRSLSHTLSRSLSHTLFLTLSFSPFHPLFLALWENFGHHPFATTIGQPCSIFPPQLILFLSFFFSIISMVWQQCPKTK